MEPTSSPPNDLESLKRKIVQKLSQQYILEQYPDFSIVQDYIPHPTYPDQLWRRIARDNTSDWLFFTLKVKEQSHPAPPETVLNDNRVFLERILEEMLLDPYNPHQSLSLDLSEALETSRLRYYHLHISLNTANMSIEDINPIEINIDLPIPSDPPNASIEHPLSDPSESASTDADPPNAAKRLPSVSPKQIRQLAEQQSPPGFAIYSTFSPKLTVSAAITATKDRYGLLEDLILEYSSSASESELTDLLGKLGQYKSFKHLAHRQCSLQEQMQQWFQKNNKPCADAIASDLYQRMTYLRQSIEHRIQILTDEKLESSAIESLREELRTFTTQHQHQSTLLGRLQPNPLLGYQHRSYSEDPGIDIPSHPQSIDLQAQYIQHNTTHSPILTLIEHCTSNSYQVYQQRKPIPTNQEPFVEYTITQKLYPKRSIFIGNAPKAIYPRLERLWGGTHEPSMEENFLHQIWCVYPILRTDPPQWLIIAATTDTQPLRSLTLPNGLLAQEGTQAYLERSLQIMAQNPDEYTHALAVLATEALTQKRVKYLHIHQTLDPFDYKPMDIVQMQFKLE